MSKTGKDTVRTVKQMTDEKILKLTLVIIGIVILVKFAVG